MKISYFLFAILIINFIKYYILFDSEVVDWDRRLLLFSKTLEEWITCQKRWLYLKQIFLTPDIQRQLVQETKNFNQVIYIKIFEYISKTI